MRVPSEIGLGSDSLSEQRRLGSQSEGKLEALMPSKTFLIGSKVSMISHKWIMQKSNSKMMFLATKKKRATKSFAHVLVRSHFSKRRSQNFSVEKKKKKQHSSGLFLLHNIWSLANFFLLLPIPSEKEGRQLLQGVERENPTFFDYYSKRKKSLLRETERRKRERGDFKLSSEFAFILLTFRSLLIPEGKLW